VKYTTISGDTFDKIAYEHYGDEKMAIHVIEANIKNSDVIVFGSGTVVTIPEVDITPASNLPPWKRGEA
jgi:phage tail protein X